MFFRNPELIDSFSDSDTQAQVGNGWYIAKPIFLYTLRERLYHAWLVFCGKATAVIFAQDG